MDKENRACFNCTHSGICWYQKDISALLEMSMFFDPEEKFNIGTEYQSITGKNCIHYIAKNK